MKYRWLYFFLSALVLGPGIYSLVRYGLRSSIDFTGGSVFEIKFTGEENTPHSREVLENFLQEGGFSFSAVHSSGESRWLLQMPPIDEAKKSEVKTALSGKFGPIEEMRFETVGPLLGKELLFKTLIAAILAASGILTFVSYQFKNRMYGVCAILAMFHDTLVLLGSFSLLGYFFGVEVDTLFVTAVLTILSFSVHDTVVVYDRIREAVKNFPKTPFDDLVNKAVNETLTRSLNNSLTIIFMLTALLLLGGPTVKWFVAALLIGTVSGTYSSTFTAAPLLVTWHKLSQKKR